MAVQIYSRIGEKYELNAEGLNSILKTVGDLPVAIYSICGPLRHGKSFLLSVFLRFLKSPGKQNWIEDPLEDFFKYRSGTKPETTGIYIWGEPFILQKSDGSRIALLMVDSQGSFDNQTTMQENAIVFSLCSLLSSHLIFNVKNQISEDILQFLQFFAGFARLGVEDAEVQSEPFQKLMFLVRDFEHGDYSYGYYDDHVSSGGKNFKRDFINPQKGSPPEVKFVHEMILDSFESVGVYLMPHPGQELARNGNFHLKKVEPEFVRHLEQLTATVLNPDKLIPKVIRGHAVTGRQLQVLVEGWAHALTQNIPETKTLYQSTAEAQHEVAKDAAIKNYDRKLKEFLQRNDNAGVPRDRLFDFHTQLMKESIELFKGLKKIGDASITREYLDALTEDIKRTFEFYVQLNNSKAEMASVKAESDKNCNRFENILAGMAEQMANLKSDQESERRRILQEMEQIQQQKDALERETTARLAQLENELKEQRAAMQNSKKKRGGFLKKLVQTVLPLVRVVVDAYVAKKSEPCQVKQ